MSSSLKILELTEENTCKLCNNALGKYTCPKCSILYCSLECYQHENHLQCSEQFYQDCVFQSLPGEAGEESKAKMLEILKRLHEQSEDDTQLDSDDEEDDDDFDLSERLAGVNLDDTEKVWEKLNDDEKKEFEAFLRSEEVSKLIKQWEPWWMWHKNDKVLDIDDFEGVKKVCPQIRVDIKDFNEISKQPYSDVIQYNLINILSSYVFTLRYFNGECLDFMMESVTCISKLSLNLSKNLNFNTYEEAIESVQNECMNLDWLQTDAENMKLMKDDIYRIMRGPHITEKKFYVLCCLSDLCNLFKGALKSEKKKKNDAGEFTKTFPESTFPEIVFESRESMKKSIKKIEFMLSYAKDILSV